MEKSEVIKLRETLRKTGSKQNTPLRIFSNNSFTIIDESNIFEFTKWDDANGILYSFKLINPNNDKHPNNKSGAVSLFAVPYDRIEAIEIPYLPIDDIDDLVDNMKENNCTFSDDYKNLIKHTFKDILHPDRITLSPSDINTIIGPDSVNDKDDYYKGKFTENFIETRRHAEHNEFIKNNSGG